MHFHCGLFIIACEAVNVDNHAVVFVPLLFLSFPLSLSLWHHVVG